MLKISNLSVLVENKKIINGISLEIKPGEIHALMGPNGAGKTSLVYALVGHPAYKVTAGQIKIDGKNIVKLRPDQRAKLGIFLSFQNPPAIPGVGAANFLNLASGSKNFSEFYTNLKETASSLHLEEEFLRRSLNEDFSGGEKKKMELLQALILQPRFVIFDEIDTGLDVDALKLVAQKIKLIARQSGVLLITHYQRLLHYLVPDKVWVLKKGKIVTSGGPQLALKIEKEGYEHVSH